MIKELAWFAATVIITAAGYSPVLWNITSGSSFFGIPNTAFFMLAQTVIIFGLLFTGRRFGKAWQVAKTQQTRKERGGW
ncbi:hypothetical protein [Marichromatium sp. PS1]|uniref:hypothetical protein n=1 Tax=Marichromatium sp. PS1 TaxID=3138932 RepID=UPI0034E860A2